MTEGLQVTRLRCEHRRDPLGLDMTVPRLSWQVRSPRQRARQAAYQVLVASSPERLDAGTGDLWDSGRLESDDCVLVPYAGRSLTSRDRVHWTVRVWDDLGESAAPGSRAWWEMGLLDPREWAAAWIAAPEPHEPSAVTSLRTTVRVDGPVGRARAYVTALGLYELRCNDARVGDARFTPGWTDYRTRLQYQVLDLTDLLRPGDNLLEAVLADGWYAGFVGFEQQREHYGTTPQLLARVEVDTTHGRTVVVTGPDWTASQGPIVSSDMLRGEQRDLQPAPHVARPVRLTEGTTARLVGSPAPPVRVLDELRPVAVTRVAPDVHRVDVGQNMVGWLRLRLGGPPGAAVAVRHAEVTNPDGTLYVDNLRSATATDTYLLGADDTVYEPSFTFHGFRYAEISGFLGDLGPDDVTAVVCGSDLEPVGEFACGDERINRLHANIVWGARGNFLDIPTDCPQRDERMGWTGDAQVFAPTACYLFDTAAFFTKWLRDLADTQTPEGSLCDVAPRVVLGPEGSPGWADAGVVVPWVVARWSGDERLLAECYPMMRGWVDYVLGRNPDLLWVNDRGWDNGDWLSVGAETDKDLIATACFARSARLTARAAETLGQGADAAELHALADGITAAFRAAYVMPDGRLKSETQTAYALALRFGLVPTELSAAAVGHLVADIDAHDGRLTTGFLGVGHLLPALTEGGRADVAYRLLLAEGFPSWLYSVKAGATTIWERWDGWTAERGFQDPTMNSFNHYAYGAVGEWLYCTVAGIDVHDGGRQITIAPVPHPALGWVRASHTTPVGRVGCSWTLSDTGLDVEVDIPVGATARVVLPTTDGADPVDIESGRYTFSVPATQLEEPR